MALYNKNHFSNNLDYIYISIQNKMFRIVKIKHLKYKQWNNNSNKNLNNFY